MNWLKGSFVAWFLFASCTGPRELGHRDRTDMAIHDPDRFAWEFFASINRPAGNGTKDVEWETWATAKDLYDHPEADIPVFPSRRHRPIQPGTPFFQRCRDSQSRECALPAISLAGQSLSGDMLGEEIRINPATFSFVVAKKLWYPTGQTTAFASADPVLFTRESSEIKAEWKNLADEADKSRYLWALDSANQPWKLVALHLTTKDLPNWFWATFEHVDNKDRCKQNGCSDTFGLDNNQQVSRELIDLLRSRGLSKMWLNYRLTGSQTDFTDSIGRPPLLVNSAIEGRRTSSCMTCHSLASVYACQFHPSPIHDFAGTPNPCWFFNAKGPTCPDPSDPPCWFLDTPGKICVVPQGKRKYLPLDFVWSLQQAWKFSNARSTMNSAALQTTGQDMAPACSPP